MYAEMQSRSCMPGQIVEELRKAERVPLRVSVSLGAGGGCRALGFPKGHNVHCMYREWAHLQLRTPEDRFACFAC